MKVCVLFVVNPELNTLGAFSVVKSNDVQRMRTFARVLSSKKVLDHISDLILIYLTIFFLFLLLIVPLFHSSSTFSSSSFYSSLSSSLFRPSSPPPSPTSLFSLLLLTHPHPSTPHFLHLSPVLFLFILFQPFFLFYFILILLLLTFFLLLVLHLILPGHRLG